jgi:hypothetical protein
MLLVWAGLLAVPATREVIRVNLGILLPFAPYHYLYQYNFSDETEEHKSLLNRIAEQTQSRHPKDPRIALGAGLLTSDREKKLAYLNQAVKLAPKEPAALLALLQAQVAGMEWERKEFDGSGWPSPNSAS